jgi:hypothetical protein
MSGESYRGFETAELMGGLPLRMMRVIHRCSSALQLSYTRRRTLDCASLCHQVIYWATKRCTYEHYLLLPLSLGQFIENVVHIVNSKGALDYRRSLLDYFVDYLGKVPRGFLREVFSHKI